MEISGYAVTALVVVVTINTLFLAAMAAALWKLNQLVGDLTQKIDPILARATETLDKVEKTSGVVEQRVNVAIDRTTHLINKVSERVDTTTAVAEEAVTGPLIGAASLVAGWRTGVQTYLNESDAGGNGETGGKA